MSKGNKTNSDVLEKLQKARALLDGCIAEFGSGPTRKAARKAAPARKSASDAALDFDANERAFIKMHGRDLSRPKRFVLLLAYLTKGKVGTEVQLKEIEKRWNRMTALMGEFNRFHTSAAKEQGWVNTKKAGLYFLRPSWKEIFH